MEITGWRGDGSHDRVRIPGLSADDRTALDEALRAACASGGDGDTVLWERPRSPAGRRNAARAVFGLAGPVIVGLLLAIAVVGSAQRPTLVAILAAVAGPGSLFVAAVWRTDVGVTVYDDGTLRRAGWNGVQRYDLRTYDRLTITP